MLKVSTELGKSAQAAYRLQYFQMILEKAGGNQTQAAKDVETSRENFLRLMAEAKRNLG